MICRSDSVRYSDDADLRERVRSLNIVVSSRHSAPTVVDVLLELAERVEVPDETLIVREGDVRGNSGFVLVDGRVSVIRSERDPVQLDAPALFGEMQQFSISGTRAATVMALGPCQLLRFEWPAFYDALESRLRPLDFQAVRDVIRRHSANNAFD